MDLFQAPSSINHSFTYGVTLIVTEAMKFVFTLFIITSLLLSSCVLNDEPQPPNGVMSLNITLKNNQVLMKTAGGGDTLFRLDTVVVTISTMGLPDTIDKIVTTSRADSSSSVIPLRNYELKSLRTYKLKIVTIDTTLNPTRHDTIHIDSMSFYISPGTTTVISKTLSSIYSILRARIKSDSASLVASNIRKTRIRINGVTQDSVDGINTKVFDHILTYKYLLPNISHSIVLQAFTNTQGTQGYERSYTISVSPNQDTLIIDSIFERSGTSQGGNTASTIKIDAGASSTTDFYVGMSIMISSGPGVGQIRTISTSNKTSKLLTVYPNWVTIPTNISQFIIYHKGLLTRCGSNGFPACTL